LLAAMVSRASFTSDLLLLNFSLFFIVGSLFGFPRTPCQAFSAGNHPALISWN